MNVLEGPGWVLSSSGCGWGGWVGGDASPKRLLHAQLHLPF